MSVKLQDRIIQGIQPYTGCPADYKTRSIGYINSDIVTLPFADIYQNHYKILMITPHFSDRLPDQADKIGKFWDFICYSF